MTVETTKPDRTDQVIKLIYNWHSGTDTKTSRPIRLFCVFILHKLMSVLISVALQGQ